MANKVNSPRVVELTRLPDWSERLTEFLVEAQRSADSMQLDWTALTCALWASDVIEVMTGVNMLEEIGISGKYEGPVSAARAIKDAGFDNLEDFVMAWFGHKEVAPIFAQRGDLLLVPARGDAVSGKLPSGTTPILTSHNQEGSLSETATHGEETMQVALAIADPPFFWAVNPEGLAKGNMLDAKRAFIIGQG